jgi:uncharacterized membrane protein
MFNQNSPKILVQRDSLMTEEDESGRQDTYSIDRVLAISDGVFAFAITLLVLDLAVPALASGASSADLLNALSKESTVFLSYLLSFLIAGVWWNAHHRNFGHIRKSDSTLRWLNLFFLLWIALLPFFTKILDQYNTLQAAVMLYAVDQAAAGILMALSWLYATRNHHLVEPNLSKSTINFVLVVNIIAPVFFIISIGVSFLNPSATSLLWYAMIPVLFIVHNLYGRHEKKQKEPDGSR